MQLTLSAEICIGIASAMAAIARLNRIWRCNTISFASKFNLYKSLVAPILLYGCETWTLLADSELKKLNFLSRLLKPMAEETSVHLLLGATDKRLGAEQDQLRCGSTGTSSGNCQETDACTVLACHTLRQKPSCRAPWREGDTAAGRENPGWTRSKSGHPCPCQNCSQWPSAEDSRI